MKFPGQRSRSLEFARVWTKVHDVHDDFFAWALRFKVGFIYIYIYIFVKNLWNYLQTTYCKSSFNLFKPYSMDDFFNSTKQVLKKKKIGSRFSRKLVYSRSQLTLFLMSSLVIQFQEKVWPGTVVIKMSVGFIRRDCLSIYYQCWMRIDVWKDWMRLVNWLWTHIVITSMFAKSL